MAAPGSARPTGSVTFSDGGVTLGKVPVSTAGGLSGASVTITDWPGGVQRLTDSTVGVALIQSTSARIVALALQHRTPPAYVPPALVPTGTSQASTFDSSMAPCCCAPAVRRQSITG